MTQSLRTTTSTSTATPTTAVSTPRAMAANIGIGVNSTTLTSRYLHANSTPTHSTTPYTAITSVQAYSEINTPLINDYLGYSGLTTKVPLAPGPGSTLGFGLGSAYGSLGVYGGYAPHITQPQMLSGGSGEQGGVGVGMARNPYRRPPAVGYGLEGYGGYGLGSRCWGMRRNPYRGVGGEGE